MFILSETEVADLLEHLEARPDIWTLHKSAWFRRGEAINDVALVVRMRDGLPSKLQLLTHKPVMWSPTACVEYVSWLLDKYTLYSQRHLVRAKLEPAVSRKVDLDALSRDVFESARR